MLPESSVVVAIQVEKGQSLIGRSAIGSFEPVRSSLKSILSHSSKQDKD